MTRILNRFFIGLAVLVVAVGTAPSAADERIGVVLMHGKGGTVTPRSPVGLLAGALDDAGFLVAAPDMPWSRSRYLAKTYEESMAEIDAAVERLKSEGAAKIVVGGHSMGANAALGYAARRTGLAGVIAIAPGHAPELGRSHSLLGGSVKKAAELVAAGNGGNKGDFLDVNQGKTSTIRTRAEIYLSWFDPSGLAVMPRNAADIRPDTPLLWVVGRLDRMFARGEGYAFAKAPANPKSSYVVVPGGHKATPVKGKKMIIDWLKSL